MSKFSCAIKNIFFLILVFFYLFRQNDNGSRQFIRIDYLAGTKSYCQFLYVLLQ